MTLPRAADRANKTLNFDVNGNPVAGLAVVATATGAVATWMGVPSSANLRAAMTDETGTGALVFATSPTLSGVTVAGNMVISGAGRRITGDFSNATIADRTIFQSSTTNGSTLISAIPNGFSSTAAFVAHEDPDIENSAYTSLWCDAAKGVIEVGKIGTGSYLPLTIYTGGTERARVTTDGEFHIAGTTDRGSYNLQVNGTGVWGAGAYVNGSDARLKEDVQDISSSLGVVLALRPVTFRYKPEHSKDNNAQPGFIAQELQEAMQGQVYLNGVVQPGPEYLNVAYQSIIPLMTKAIQEQQSIIEQLTQRIAALEGQP
jgi:hypothetical protein